MNIWIELGIELLIVGVIAGLCFWLTRKFNKAERKNKKKTYHKENFKVKIPKGDNEYEKKKI